MRAEPKKIWIDLDNSPHVLFFAPIIKELEKLGYRVIVTVRDYAQVCGLANLFNLEYTRIGRHYGKNKILKTVGLLIRALEMIPVLLTEKPNLALSHGSRSQIVIARFAGIPTVMAFDYEYTQWIPFIRPTLGLVPELLTECDIIKKVKRIASYPGIKEDVYLHNFVPNTTILKSLGIDDGKVIVTIRPPASVAHYHVSTSDELFEAIIDSLGHRENIQMVMLPRTKEQDVKIRKKWSNLFEKGKIIIPDQVLNGLNLIWHSDIVISGGGTIIREAAALNVPAYSFFGGKIGVVDKYLSDNKRLFILKSVEDIHSRINLIKRNRPSKPINNNTNALRIIVNEIIKILEGE